MESWAGHPGYFDKEGSATLSSFEKMPDTTSPSFKSNSPSGAERSVPAFRSREKPVPVLVKAKHHLPLRLLVWISGAIGILAALLIVKGKILLGILCTSLTAGISLGIAASETSAPVRVL